MAYTIRAVNESGITTKTYLYDTPEETLSTNPVEVDTPEGIKYAATDLSTQKAYLKCVDGNGNIRRINAKSKDVYVTIRERTIGAGNVAYPIKGDSANLSDTFFLIVFEGQEEGAFPLTISASSGLPFNYSPTAQDRYHFDPVPSTEGTSPGFGLLIDIECSIYTPNESGGTTYIRHPYGSFYIKGGAGAGISNSISKAGGSGTCSISGSQLCGVDPQTAGCGCTYVSLNNYTCSWSSCSASSPVERGGYGAKAERFVTLPALTDKSFRASLLAEYAHLGVTEIKTLHWYITYRVPAPASSMFGTRGTCTSEAGHCGSYYRGTYYRGGCRDGGCTSYTTNAKCSCTTSKAGTSVNGVDGGMEGVTTQPSSEVYPTIKIESIR